MNQRTSVLVVLLIIVVVGGALFVAFSGGKQSANGCRAGETSAVHKATIRDGKVSNDHIYGKVCDTITITNKDAMSREIAFGNHDHHVPYDGVTERVLGENESFTITLDKAGSYHWHDHLHDEVEGFFTVTQ
jgi:plastocyanin